MHDRNETNEVLLAEIAKKINEIENLKIELYELAGDLSEPNDRYSVEDFCGSVEDAIADVVSYFGYDSAIDFMENNNEE